MRARSDPRALALVLAIASSSVGCSKAPTTPTSSDAVGRSTAEERDPLAELAALEQRMLQLGLPIASSVPAAERSAGAATNADAPAGAHTEASDAESQEEQEPQPASGEAARKRSPAGREQVQRCADICDLIRAICELEVQICELSDAHGDNPIYADACRRAHEDCDTADGECDRCRS